MHAIRRLLGLADDAGEGTILHAIDCLHTQLGGQSDALATLRAQLAAAKEKVVEPFAGDVPLCGEYAPRLHRVTDWLRTLATVRHRVGDTTVAGQLAWGALACWAKDAVTQRAEKAEADNANLHRQATSLLNEVLAAHGEDFEGWEFPSLANAAADMRKVLAATDAAGALSSEATP